MKLMPWRHSSNVGPFGDLFDFQKEFNRLFDSSFELKSMWGPAVDIYQDKHTIKIKADLPGLKEEQIDVSVNEGILTIKGERKHEEEKKDKDYYRSERTYGAFERSFSLPSTVDASKTTAEYKNGVLEIALTKKEDAIQKKIKINNNK